MLTIEDLKEYRKREGLTLDDIERYSDVKKKSYSDAELHRLNLTERIYENYVKGINGCLQAKADGTFEVERRKFLDERKRREKERKEKLEKEKLEKMKALKK